MAFEAVVRTFLLCVPIQRTIRRSAEVKGSCSTSTRATRKRFRKTKKREEHESVVFVLLSGLNPFRTASEVSKAQLLEISVLYFFSSKRVNPEL